MKVFIFDKEVSERKGFPYNDNIPKEELKKERIIYLTQLIYSGDEQVKVISIDEFESIYNWSGVIDEFFLIDDITMDDVPSERLREILNERKKNAIKKAREARKKEEKYFYFEGVIDKKIGISNSPQFAKYSVISDYLKESRGKLMHTTSFKLDTNVFSRFNMPRKGDTVRIRALNLKAGPKLETAKIEEVIKKGE